MGRFSGINRALVPAAAGTFHFSSFERAAPQRFVGRSGVVVARTGAVISAAKGARTITGCTRLGIMPSHLLAILHSLPPGTGVRTLQRVDIAQRVLGCVTSSIANVYPAVLSNTKALNVALSPEVFEEGRALIRRELDREETSDVLLAYGMQLPTGPNRHDFRAQLDWVAAELGERKLRVWLFGGRPSHPSRWHRQVSRERPGSTVEACAAEFLVQHHPERSIGSALNEAVRS